MNVLTAITSAAILFAVVGNSSATTNLGPAFPVSGGGKVELTVWITPHADGDPIPPICRLVTFTPVIAHMDTNTAGEPVGEGVYVAVLDTGIDVLDSFDLRPGQLAKITINNEETFRKNVSVEFMVDPPDAQEICGPKASGVVFDLNGNLLGGPTKLNEQFKAIPPSSTVFR